MFPFRYRQPYHDIHNFNPSPDVQQLHRQLEEDMQRMRNEVESRMQWMEQGCGIPPHRLGLESRAIQSGPLAASRDLSPRPQLKGNFELSLDVEQVPPENLMVKTDGRRLIVTGNHEYKREAGDGGVVHEYRECRKEAEIPEDVNPRDVMCSMSKDGRLHFQAPRLALPAAGHRVMPVIRDIHIPIMVDSRWTAGGQGGH